MNELSNHSEPEASGSTQIRAMYMSDLHRVLEIITDHDDDDGEAAEQEFDDEGIEDQFVLLDDELVIGISGYRTIEACDGSYWLSWTYLDEAYRGKGLGKKMLNDVLARLKEQGARKLFVKVSDYKEDGENIYAAAMAMYQSAGFSVEVVSNDFYDEGESQTILGLYLSPTSESSENTLVADEKPVIRFNGLHEIIETDGAFSFAWIVEKSKGLFENRGFSTEDLNIGLREVAKQGGRKVFLTFPSNLVLIHEPLQAAGFKFVGQLKDYYEVGLHELHFSHNLDDLGASDATTA